MDEQWRHIEGFRGYSVSDWGRIRSDKSGRILVLSQNQYGLVYVGMVKNKIQYHRSVPLLVASAFIPNNLEPFDTPINLDGDRFNNHVDNLVWRPRWFAIKYNQQFKWPCASPIERPIQDLKTGEVSDNSFECSIRYGILESDLIQSISSRTFVWPTYQQFAVL